MRHIPSRYRYCYDKNRCRSYHKNKHHLKHKTKKNDNSNIFSLIWKTISQIICVPDDPL